MFVENESSKDPHSSITYLSISLEIEMYIKREEKVPGTICFAESQTKSFCVYIKREEKALLIVLLLPKYHGKWNITIAPNKHLLAKFYISEDYFVS